MKGEEDEEKKRISSSSRHEYKKLCLKCPQRLILISISWYHYISHSSWCIVQPPKNHKHTVATDDCVFAEPSLVPICSGRSALLSCSVSLYITRKEEQEAHQRIVYHSVCAAWHKVCSHTVAACQRCHTSTGNKVHGDESQFVMFVISVVKKGRKKAALSSYIGFLSLLVSSTIPAGHLFWKIASIVAPEKKKCRKANFKLVKWIVPLNSVGCQLLRFRGKTKYRRRLPKVAPRKTFRLINTLAGSRKWCVRPSVRCR